MSASHREHAGPHSHQHGPNCGHIAVKHDDHTDYLHDGHLHYHCGDHVDDHYVAVSPINPENCTPGHVCSGHDKTHIHGANCGHEAVPHGSHTDYLVDGHLHHVHGTHCDDHGELQLAAGRSSSGAA